MGVFNRQKDGKEFPYGVMKKVWDKSKPVVGCPGFAQDRCGALIKLDDFSRNSEFGWEIDHIIPLVEGGTDDLDNLQPLQWENNRFKDDDYPKWRCRRKG